MTTIAFLGLGHMGAPMAARLREAGHDVVGFDVVPELCQAARETGMAVASSALDAVAGVDVVITMFPSGRHVLDAFAGVDGSGGLLDAADPGTLFLECSTIAVSEAREAHFLAANAGQRCLDAPVSGGVVGAEKGTLTFMVGGGDDDLATARPLLEVMGGRIVHCGGPGLGQAAKVCNNMILGVSQIVVAEGFVLGERLGLSHEALYDVAAHASGQCWALSVNCPVPGPVPTSPANHDYQPGFAGSLMAKDLGLALHAIEQTGVDAELGRAAQRIYAEFASGAGAREDFSGIINTIRAASADG